MREYTSESSEINKFVPRNFDNVIRRIINVTVNNKILPRKLNVIKLKGDGLSINIK